MKVLVTGSNGFIGRNLCVTLENREGMEVLRFDVGQSLDDLKNLCGKADFVFHLAGVNRPEKVEEFRTGNLGLTEILLSILEEQKRLVPVVLSSSTQALLDNPYGRSKRQAEDRVFEWSRENRVPGIVYRFPNVFGKWCRPNYNSVVATWGHAIAHGEEIRIDDPQKTLTLVYIDHVVTELLKAMEGHPTLDADGFGTVPGCFRVTLADLAERLQAFHHSRETLLLPDSADLFDKCLYATYLSYLPETGLAYDLFMREDPRGSLAEFLKSPHCGQLFVSRTKPGITRGHHWHHTKVEKFLVVEGEAEIRLRRVGQAGVVSYAVSGQKWQVVDIPPGTTHSITNTGKSDLVTLFWANEILDLEKPDTFRLEV
jgi:UDP-2-acetamido-2,6-beta-L-arabino-hexul-4-ose reductase